MTHVSVKPPKDLGFVAAAPLGYNLPQIHGDRINDCAGQAHNPVVGSHLRENP